MGIYIQGYGTLTSPTPTNLASRLTNVASSLTRQAPKNLASRLIDVARRWSADQGLQDLFYASSSDAGVWLTFYPPAGGIEFDVEGYGISFGTKTSIAGPGYHAAIVELCDRLQSELEIAWRWGSGGDETGFALDRDFEALQDAFLDQAAAFGEFHRDQVGIAEGHAVNLPEGLAVDCFRDVATPLGPVRNQLFLDAPDSSEDAEALARQIFPWWSKALDQEFWMNTLRALLWTEVQWRAARTPWESHVRQAALALGARCGSSLDKDLARAVDELAELSGDPESFAIPAAEGVGYKRRKRAFLLPGPWRINLPGYYIELDEDDGSTTCLWYENEEIRGSSFTIQTDDAAANIWSAELEGEPDRKGKGCTFRIQPHPSPSEDSPGYFNGLAEFVARDREGNVRLLVVSVYDAEENLTPRLVEIAENVWFDEPNPRDVKLAN